MSVLTVVISPLSFLPTSTTQDGQQMRSNADDSTMGTAQSAQIFSSLLLSFVFPNWSHWMQLAYQGSEETKQTNLFLSVVFFVVIVQETS